MCFDYVMGLDVKNKNASPFQWTTDEDLTDAIGSIGIKDLLEIKFFENRANGQSKG